MILKRLSFLMFFALLSLSLASSPYEYQYKLEQFARDAVRGLDSGDLTMDDGTVYVTATVNKTSPGRDYMSPCRLQLVGKVERFAERFAMEEFKREHGSKKVENIRTVAEVRIRDLMVTEDKDTFTCRAPAYTIEPNVKVIIFAD